MLGLAGLLGRGAVSRAATLTTAGAPVAPTGGSSRPAAHFAPRAKRVIFLFLNGGPSHIDTFDPKPALARYEGQQPSGDLYKKSKGSGFMPSPLKFDRCGQSGTEVSESLPHEQVRFAHNSERQFAKLLDFYGITWEYEPRTFTLEADREGNPVQAFTPDFYLPAYDTFIEITTLNQKLVTKKNRKARRLRELHPEVQIKVFYQRDYLHLLVKYGLEPPSQLADVPGEPQPLDLFPSPSPPPAPGSAAESA